MAEIKKKQSFGGVNVARFSPEVPPEARKTLNVDLTYEEGLKLYFGLGQLLGKLNSYNRSTKAGRRSAATLCIYLHKRRITIVESKLPSAKASSRSVKTVATAPPEQDP